MVAYRLKGETLEQQGHRASELPSRENSAQTAPRTSPEGQELIGIELGTVLPSLRQESPGPGENGRIVMLGVDRDRGVAALGKQYPAEPHFSGGGSRQGRRHDRHQSLRFVHDV